MTDKGVGTLYVAGPKKEPARIATGAQDPAIAGKGPIVVTWEGDDGVMTRVLAGRK